MNVLRWKKPSKYNLVDNIVCHGFGLASGGLAAFLTDRAIQSSQRYTSLSRIVLDAVVGLVVIGIVTGLGYRIRNGIFYGTKQVDGGDGDGRDWWETIATIDRRNGKEVKRKTKYYNIDNR